LFTRFFSYFFLFLLGVSLKEICSGGRFIVNVDQCGDFSLNYSETEQGEGLGQLCNVSTRVFVVGDLKFYAQMLGRNNMSGSWCMWCTMAPHEWKLPSYEDVPIAHREQWTIETLKAAHLKIVREGLKEPQDIRGVTGFPLWDCIPVKHFVYPVLHGEIGLVNDAIDALYDILDQDVEIMSNEEKTARNNFIVAQITLENGRRELLRWKEERQMDIESFEVAKKDAIIALKRRNLSIEERNQIKEDKEYHEQQLKEFKEEKKNLEANVKSKRETLKVASTKYKEIRTKKKKIDRPVRAEVILILEKYEISAAAYHGGDLNGVSARRLMKFSSDIFNEIKAYLLSYQHADRCTDDCIEQVCFMFSSIFSTLNLIT
jgi:hypothetical protein